MKVKYCIHIHMIQCIWLHLYTIFVAVHARQGLMKDLDFVHTYTHRVIVMTKRENNLQ